jgi:drug/metabolite transporter (DMT)-like permease
MIADELGTAGFIACILGAVSFVVAYTVTAPWWRTVTGRIVWCFAAVCMSILLLAGYRTLFTPPPWWGYVRVTAYMLLAASIWTAVVALVRVQLLRRKATKANKDNEDTAYNEDTADIHG